MRPGSSATGRRTRQSPASPGPLTKPTFVDEIIVSFTHDCEIPAILPGVSPTGRKVVLPHVAVVGFKDGEIAYEHIYWDQASLLVQIGLPDKSKRPVTGAEQAGCPPTRSSPRLEVLRVSLLAGALACAGLGLGGRCLSRLRRRRWRGRAFFCRRRSTHAG